MVAIGPVVFFVLLYITAPYGRYERKGWGPVIPGKAGWFIMEAPASLIMLSVFLFVEPAITVVTLLLIWQVHYFHRAFIYPFTLRSTKPMPVLVMLMAIVFNTVNAYLNGYHFVLHADWYGTDWLLSINFVAGLILFAAGFYVTKKSDSMLRELRNDDETGYQVPYGFLYRWVSCPNYLGESFQWLGWALMTLSPAAWVFLLWTLCNLVPRAISHQRWYRETFPEYPRERKALIPYVL